MAEQQEQVEQTAQTGEQAMTPADDTNKSLRLAIIFSSIVLWIMAIFMINILYSINAKIDTLSQYMQATLSVAGQRPLDSFQVVDKDGNVVYSFRVDPTLEEMPPEAMNAEMGCDMPAGGPKAAPGTDQPK